MYQQQANSREVGWRKEVLALPRVLDYLDARSISTRKRSSKDIPTKRRSRNRLAPDVTHALPTVEISCNEYSEPDKAEASPVAHASPSETQQWIRREKKSREAGPQALGKSTAPRHERAVRPPLCSSSLVYTASDEQSTWGLDRKRDKYKRLHRSHFDDDSAERDYNCGGKRSALATGYEWRCLVENLKPRARGQGSTDVPHELNSELLDVHRGDEEARKCSTRREKRTVTGRHALSISTRAEIPGPEILMELRGGPRSEELIQASSNEKVEGDLRMGTKRASGTSSGGLFELPDYGQDHFKVMPGQRQLEPVAAISGYGIPLHPPPGLLVQNPLSIQHAHSNLSHHESSQPDPIAPRQSLSNHLFYSHRVFEPDILRRVPSKPPKRSDVGVDNVSLFQNYEPHFGAQYRSELEVVPEPRLQPRALYHPEQLPTPSGRIIAVHSRDCLGSDDKLVALSPQSFTQQAQALNTGLVPYYSGIQSSGSSRQINGNIAGSMQEVHAATYINNIHYHVHVTPSHGHVHSCCGVEHASQAYHDSYRQAGPCY
ncbi:hypothetical protein BJ508DRAFT_419058 [Ascobolus immersus RN42]|uniref:Uncharacterized protein n=1 Tax=Ascobolus immersus RN42 TaxID=1160509 RepID=A0A3N4HHC1_ASCIM|nr:hypothetical protein BJ508DRAFT_419058 [Ascobolus immersus RN42]